MSSTLSGNSLATTDVTVSGTTTTANLTATGTTTLAGATTSADITFGDNDKAIFGAGSDLQIYHDGDNSYIKDAGTGNLVLNAGNFRLNTADNTEALIRANADSYVRLYHSGDQKLETTSTGIDVTGTIAADAANIAGAITADGLTVDKGSDSSDIAKFTGSNTGRALAIQSFQSGSSAGAGFELNATSLEGAIRIATAGNDRALFSPNGDISFYEDTGTTAKFFWDASAEYLSVGGTTGTFAPINYLGSNGRLGINNGNTSGGTKIQSFATTNANGYLAFEGYDKEYMRIDSSGNVGIGTGVSGSVSPSLRLGNAGASGGDVTGTLSLGSYGTAFGSSITSSSNFSANSQSYLAFSTTPSGAVGGTQPIERMRIDSSGNVGIGTSSPKSKLEVADGNIIVGSSTNTNSTNTLLAGYGYNIGATTYGNTSIRSTYSNSNNSASLEFYTAASGVNTAERMRIDSSGNLLVGTTSAASGFKLQVDGGAGNARYTNIDTGGSTFDQFRFNGGLVGSITTNGVTTSYNTASDYRLKEDWQPMVSNFDRVSALNPVNFAWKADGSRVDGFLAHELAEVVPEAVTGTKDAMRTEEYEVTPAVLDDEGNVVTEAVMGTRDVPDYQAIDQSKLVPLLTAALQEAVAKIESLEARLDAANL